MREVKIMKEVDHPNIIKLYQVIQSSNTVYLIMEYAAGGEVFFLNLFSTSLFQLFDFLLKNGKLREPEARKKFRQMVSAVEYLHKKNIVHRY